MLHRYTKHFSPELSFLIMLVFLFNCNHSTIPEPENTIIHYSGRVLDEKNLIPLAGVKIEFSHEVRNGSFWGPIDSTIFLTVSDDSGYFEVTYDVINDQDSRRPYYLDFSISVFFPVDYSEVLARRGTYSELPYKYRNKTINVRPGNEYIEVYMLPGAYIQYLFLTDTPLDSGETLVYPEGTVRFENAKTSDFLWVPGDSLKIISWGVKRNNKEVEHHLDTIFVPRWKVTKYEINY